jgi:hypothetical protein
MKLGISLKAANLATLPGPSRPGGIIVPLVLERMPSTEGRGSPSESCALELELEYFKTNKGRLKVGDYVYLDPEGTQPLSKPAVYGIDGGEYFQNNSKGYVLSVAACPQPIAKFASTTISRESRLEACATIYEETSFYKEGEGLVARGNKIYVDEEAQKLAEEGYYKQIFKEESFWYEVKRFGVVGDVDKCEGPDSF